MRAALVTLLLPVLVASAPAPSVLPDLDQAAPFGVSVTDRHGRLLLVFGSAVDNVGPGDLIVEGRRVGDVMRAWQIVGGHRYPLRTPLRYVRSATHQHWHLEAFERYELRRAGALVRRDRKTGFCLNDAYETRALNRSAALDRRMWRRTPWRAHDPRGNLAGLRRRLRPAARGTVDRRHRPAPWALRPRASREPGTSPAGTLLREQRSVGRDRVARPPRASAGALSRFGHVRNLTAPTGVERETEGGESAQAHRLYGAHGSDLRPGCLREGAQPHTGGQAVR